MLIFNPNCLLKKMEHSLSHSNRDNFKSPWTFVMAAIGSAVGLGNLWRFPYLAYKHGGSAFFVAYITCIIIIGLPFLISEVGLGQISRKAAPQAIALAGNSKKYSIVGWLAVVISFIILTYYVVITSWTANFIVHSFTQPWVGSSSTFFYQSFLHLSNHINQIGNLNLPVIIGTVVTLLLLFIGIYKGTSGISVIGNWITPIPFILLIILLINSVCLSGASIGLKALLIPKWGYLKSIDLWFDAASQVLFSLSLAFGVMFAYGSLLNKNINIKKLAFVVIFGDTFAAVLGGIIIFSVLGHMALIQNISISNVVQGGIGLAFVIIPKALSLLPYGSKLFSIIFYISLFLLAYTSIVSLFESILASILDSKFKVNRAYTLLILIVLISSISITYSFDNGLYLLDIVDHFVSGYGILIVSILECIMIGWIYGAEKLRYQLKKQSRLSLSFLFNISIRIIIPLTLLVLIFEKLKTDISFPYENYPIEFLMIFGCGSLILLVVLAKILQKVFD